MNDKPEKRIVRTSSFCSRGTFTDLEERERLLCLISEELTKAVRSASGGLNLTIQCKNILDRDTNPDGHQFFFVVTDDRDLLETEGGPFYFYKT